MATPYSEEVIARAKRYYETKYGITVVASESLGATNSYAIGKMDAGVAQAAFGRIDRPDIDALVVPGGNFPTMDWIAPWERQFGKPVITTNQATLWAVMRAMRHQHAARRQRAAARADAGGLVTHPRVSSACSRADPHSGSMGTLPCADVADPRHFPI